MSPKEMELSARIDELKKKNEQLGTRMEKFYSILVGTESSFYGIEEESLQTADTVELLIKLLQFDLKRTKKEFKRYKALCEGTET
jgi:hypothetical protein